jgi:small subunit ribosomal protein S7
LILNKSIIISFVKIVQKSGLKELSELVMFNVFRFIKKMTGKCPFILFIDSFNKAKPFSEIKMIKISGISYKVPVEIKPKRQKNLVFRWIAFNSFNRNNINVSLNLAEEILDTCNFTSKTIRQRIDFHKIAELNKIYMHYKY